jgi:molecular chaperone GrpE
MKCSRARAMQAAIEERDAKLAEVEKAQEEMRDKVLRTLADMENLRSRTAKQIEEARQFSLQGFAKDVLEVADNLERAISSVPQDLLEEMASRSTPLDAEVLVKNLKSLHNGVAMSHKVRHSRVILQAYGHQTCG